MSECRARGDEFGDSFVLASKRLADERGVEIIHAVMACSHNWKGEEGMLFAPLIDFLPRRPALELLQKYQRSKWTSERVWAGEYITEFEMPDTQKGIRKYSRKK